MPDDLLICLLVCLPDCFSDNIINIKFTTRARINNVLVQIGQTEIYITFGALSFSENNGFNNIFNF